jgi:hypothetical protein
MDLPIPPSKDPFLDNMLATSGIMLGQPWIIGGDFNMITSLLEKKGGQKKLDNEIYLSKKPS